MRARETSRDMHGSKVYVIFDGDNHQIVVLGKAFQCHDNASDDHHP